MVRKKVKGRYMYRHITGVVAWINFQRSAPRGFEVFWRPNIKYVDIKTNSWGGFTINRK